MRHLHNTPLEHYFANIAGFMAPMVLCVFFYICAHLAGSLPETTNPFLRIATDPRVLAGLLAGLIAVISKIAFRTYQSHKSDEVRMGAIGVLQGSALVALFLLLLFLQFLVEVALR